MPHHVLGLLTECVVQVVGTTDTGSGVLIAPGFVLTCAHVVRSDPAVTVKWHGNSYAGSKVVFASQAPSRRTKVWGYPDLAIVAVDIPNHPCAKLDFRTPRLDDPLHAQGFADKYDQGWAIDSATPRYDGTSGGFWQVAVGEFARGMSGGPVLNVRTGGVCALVKTSRQPGAAQGGLLAPIHGLRQADRDLYQAVVRGHDRYHADGSRPWSRHLDALIDDEPTGRHHRKRWELTPAEERILRGVLAGMPAAGDHAARFESAGPSPAPQDHRPLLDHGDVVTELAELMPGDGLPYVLRFAAALVAASAPGTADDLYRWLLLSAGAMQRSEEMLSFLQSPERPPDVESVMIRLRPSGHDCTKYDLTVWNRHASGTVVARITDPQAKPFEEVKQRIFEILPEQIDALAHAPGGSPSDLPVMIEFFLPVELMDETFEAWTPWPEQWSRLGRRHPTVVRDLRRTTGALRVGDWERRFRSLQGDRVGSVLEVVGCDDEIDHESMEGRLQLRGNLAVLALGSSPLRSGTGPALDVGLYSGVPVLIWRRASCTGTDGPECPGRHFLDDLRRELADVHGSDLPRRVWALRNEAAGRRDDTHCGAQLVLLWDDPNRRPPHDRMIDPEETRLDV
ncbi:VMAP-C domain-containing protein [Paractinoplanes durhamensis]|uniref:VMAP-C domain-containing protein n=1 Tax=Paractinoplanes durhamensis TaxID=113563 RepID=UPI003626C073